MFSSWSDACTGGGTCSVTISTDKSVVAHFTQITHTLTIAVDPVGGGTTTPSVGVHSYPEGTVVDVTAAPAAGYVFSSWSGACTGGGACSVTISTVQSVTAHYTQLDIVTLTISSTMAVRSCREAGLLPGKI